MDKLSAGSAALGADGHHSFQALNDSDRRTARPNDKTQLKLGEAAIAVQKIATAAALQPADDTVNKVVTILKERSDFQDKVSAAALPVGSVVAFWGALTEIPIGFELCDGTAVHATGSPIATRLKPDLRNAFVKGALADNREM